MFDRYILKNFPVQYVIRGEGEIALPALCKALEDGKGINDVPNLTWITPEGKIMRNPIAPLISGEELAKFPLPDYGVLPPNAYAFLGIESSRGCVFDCSFCSTSYRRSWRPIPAEALVDRIEGILKYRDRTSQKDIFIVDDEFLTDSIRGSQIAKIIQDRGLGIKLLYNCRATDVLSNSFSQDLIDITRGALVGAECGYDEGLKRIGKGTTCKILEDSARKLSEKGVADLFEYSFILGFPWESRTDVDRTIKFAASLHTRYEARLVLQWYLNIPGSRMWDELRQRQLVYEAMYNGHGLFNDLYLFRLESQLEIKDYWGIHDTLTKLCWLSNLKYPKEQRIKAGIPTPILTNFDRGFSDHESDGLASLRDVSNPECIMCNVDK
jgi:radical SAM superfamily enzyme YgiQ (UPF0313 family)